MTTPSPTIPYPYDWAVIGVYYHQSEVDIITEAPNVLNATTEVTKHKGYTTETFTRWLNSSTYQYRAIVVPELEKRKLTTDKASDAVLVNWVKRGGVLVVTGDSRGYGTEFLNQLFSRKYAYGSRCPVTTDRTRAGDLYFGKAKSDLATRMQHGLWHRRRCHRVRGCM